MKNIYFLLLITFAGMSAFAQNNFKPGYIISLQGDTSKGYINQKEWTQNPRSVTFKIDLAQKPVDYNTTNISGFGIDEKNVFKRFVLMVSRDEVEITRLSEFIDSTAKLDTVFLRALSVGNPVNLYVYADNIKKRFFIQEGNRLPQELINRYYIDPETNHKVNQALFKGQLNAVNTKLNASTSGFLTTISKITYTDDDLIKTLNKINHISSDKKEISLRSGCRFYAGIGVYHTSIKYSGETPLADNATNEGSNFPKVDIGFDYLQNADVGRLILRTNLSFAYGDFRVLAPAFGSTFYERKFNQYIASITPQFIYNIYNKQTLKIFVGGGIAINGYLHPKNEYNIYDADTQTSTDISNTAPDVTSLRSVWISFPVRAGTTINKKIELFAEYNYPVSVTQLVGYEGRVYSLSGGVHYFFGKH